MHIAHRPVNGGECAQAEEVELHQADFFDVILVKLAHRAVAALGAIQRTEIGQFARRDQHATRMHTDVTGQVFQALAQLQQLGHPFFAAHNRIKLGLNLARFSEGNRLDPFQWHQLGQTITQTIGKIHHAPHVADHGLGRQCAESDDLRHAGCTVFLLNVVNYTLAPVLAEVDVEVGHRHALRIKEALEQQLVTQGVKIGNAQTISHQRTGTGTAPRSHRHAVIFRPADKVRHDQEVAGEAHLDNGLDFKRQTA